MNPSGQQLSSDSEATVAAFSFDESKTIDENLALFFEHMATYDRQFADFLGSHLPAVLANNDRSIFNVALVPSTYPPRASVPS